MNTKAVKSFGLALMLAAGILAVLLAMGTFPAQKAAAQVSATGVSVRPDAANAGDPLILTVGFQVENNAAITAGQEIAIKLPGLAVPGEINATDVSIRSGASAGSPSAVVVSTKDGVSTVTLTLGNDSGGVPMFVTGSSAGSAQVYVTFTKAAGLAAGTTAGNYWVTVDGQGAVTGDVPNAFDVSPSVTVSHKAGFTSTKLMVSGASFPAGVVDITVVNSAGDPASCATATAGTAATAGTFDGIAVKSGAFSVPIKIAVADANDEAFRYGGNCVFVVHSAGGVDGATDLATGLQPAGQLFSLSAKVTTADDLVRGGDSVDVKVEEGPATAIVTGVTIDGTPVPFAPKAAAGAAQATPTVAGGTIADGSATTEASRTLDAAGEITLVINVKDGDGAALPAASEVSLSVVASAATPPTLGSATVNVVSLPLDLRPDTAVQGTTVTLNASGFGTGGIGGSGTGTLQILGSDDGATVRTIDVTANTVGGRYTFIFDVPDLPAGDALVRLTQSDGKIGEGTLTISAPTITASATESRVGSNIRVAGTGFPAGGSVIITYGAAKDDLNPAYIADTVVADPIGNWESVIQVPSSASGKSYIQAFRPSLGEDSGVDERMSNALEHTVPAATLTVEPKSGLVGETITVSGTAHAPRTIVEVTIGGVVVSERDDRTNAIGDFSVEVTIPPVSDEFPTMVVKVNGEEVIGGRVIIQILKEAPAPDSRAPVDVFKTLVGAGTLEAFWGYDNEDGVWRVYIPGNTPEQNSRLQAADLLLTEVNVGDAGWINLNADDTFGILPLKAGWRLIAITN